MCFKYYNKVKEDSVIFPKFLRYLKKAGSLFRSVKFIIECTHNIKYNSLFSNAKLCGSNEFGVIQW